MTQPASIDDDCLSFIKEEGVNLIFINEPLFLPYNLFTQIWWRASIKLCADGAANRLFDYCNENGQDASLYLPDAIVGDLDSIREEVCVYYREKGVYVCKIDDANTTDFSKCLSWLTSMKREVYTIVLGGLTGRFDHVLGCLYTLYQYPCEKIYLMNHENLVTLLTAGLHQITVDQRTQGPSCGLVPLDSHPIVSTRNLVWELREARCSFQKGGMISTSNKIKQDPESSCVLVTVKTSGNILWVLEHRMR